MKKMIALIVVITTILICVTKSLYVEWVELFILIGSLTVISVIFNLFSKRQRRISSYVGSSAIIGFLVCWIFGLIDLIADHFMYYLPTGYEDGRALSLGFKIQEYSDDLFVGSVITMISVILVSFLLTTLLSKAIPKNP
ncbi:hypothetical protein [Paenibacillus chungangensis]|uniref:DUF4199 domain-containing protein n=1 Tax=Paenibacillus chungangensis TaxID=696535 RepID=A0ABW3HSF7_9BACL